MSGTANPEETGAEASAATMPAAAPEANPIAPDGAEKAINLPLVTICTILASTMYALDSTIANVALPYMRGSMSASQDEINWVLTSYIVAGAIMTAPIGYISARFGRTKLFLFSVIGFSITSILCGAAQSLDQMVLFRILQGVAGAPLIPLSQAVMFDIYPVEKRGFAMGLWATGVNLGPILGPTFGGWITEHYSWRWVFYINVPLGVITAVGMVLFLRETVKTRTARLDWLGFAALALAIAAFQTMLDRGETLDWFSSPEIMVEAVLAGVGFYIFIVQSALAPHPFLSPKLFTDVNFVAGTTIYFTLGLIMYAIMALLTPFLQDLMGYPVSTAGMVMAPRGFGTMLAAVVAGRLVRVAGVRALIAFGLSCFAFAVYQMTLWTTDISEWDIVFTGLMQGIGVSFISIPLSVSAFSTLPITLRTEATGVYSLLRNLGSSIGVSASAALVVSNTQVNHAILSGGITPFDRMLQSGAPGRLWNPHVAAGAAGLDDEITRQASIIAYIDDFKLMFLLLLLVFPLTFLIRTPAQRR